MESSDIYVEIEPLPAGGGIELSLTSVVYEQFGKEIEEVIKDTLKGLAVTDVKSHCKRQRRSGMYHQSQSGNGSLPRERRRVK